MAGRHVALLRGINVGTAKRVAMADLRAIVEGLGYHDVRTLLNSGNVGFFAPAKVRGRPGPRIEQALVDQLGVSARVTVLTAGEVNAAIAENPLAKVTTDPSRLLVAVLRDPADRPRLEPLVKQDWGPDVLALGTRVAYLGCARGILESRLLEVVSRALGDGVTTRNWGTILKLGGLLGAEASDG
jgi:uncharacterized protein (DUF1697 family)